MGLIQLSFPTFSTPHSEAFSCQKRNKMSPMSNNFTPIIDRTFVAQGFRFSFRRVIFSRVWSVRRMFLGLVSTPAFREIPRDARHEFDAARETPRFSQKKSRGLVCCSSLYLIFLISRHFSFLEIREVIIPENFQEMEEKIATFLFFE
ncbi:uncharacterized protein LOC143146645 [Ptiloglossa arizonensis]|uniref:uncharacterized protein LOC143146645 n=1 Tax=Ptiloglossa arizonensis TaxID=3350558 RepID=UPI003F9F6A31